MNERPADCRSSRVSVVIPARNEAKNIAHVLGALPQGMHEVILVDGHSVDDTVAAARRCRSDIRVVTQSRKGKGNALACGFRAVTGDIIVMIDADGSTAPEEIPDFVASLCRGADFAKGTRFAKGGESLDISHVRQAGNAALNALVNLLFRTRYTDLCYGYNAFWTDVLPVLDLPETVIPGLGGNDMIYGDGFEIETLMNVRVAAAGLRIAEVGSVERERLSGESNLHAVRDGIRVLRTISREWWTSRRRSTRPPGKPEPQIGVGRRTAATVDLTTQEMPVHTSAAHRIQS
jgi:glycosyltransferase involved in cell wall biosynthesis